jgi:hypothetical protein
MVQQVATTGGGTAFLNRLDKAGIILQDAIDGLLYHLPGILAGSESELPQTRFFVG